jgi:two-component system nitrate/nitrite sensor histidine kinase NarX
MKRFFPAVQRTLRDSLLTRTAIAMGFLALLSLGSIVISTVIADDISGRANAVNMSGSLRFLSYRTLSEVQVPEKREQALETIKVFERRLLNLDRFVSSKGRADSLPVRELQSVLLRWNTQIMALELQAAQGDASALRQISHEIPDFVDQIDRVVYMIEHELEERARWLRIAQLVLLGLIVAVSVFTIWMLRQQLVQPLTQLLQASQSVTQGSFSARVKHDSGDELGRLGQAFNVMVGEIANMYAHLEDKVEEKTREIQRTNDALNLLYRVSQRLSATDLTLDQVKEVLGEVEIALDLGHSMLCISENDQYPAHKISASLSRDERHALCSNQDCGTCFLRAEQPLLLQDASTRMIAIPIGDGDRLRGILPILKNSDAPLSIEKARSLKPLETTFPMP